MASVTTSLWLVGVDLHAWADRVSVDGQLNIFQDGTNAVVFWKLPTECGTNFYLQNASSAGGPWSTLTNSAEPYLMPLDQGGGQFFNEYACLLHEGKAQTLGPSFGGYGLMSGLMQGEGFYFTYSWGSGIHRSHVGKLQIVSNELKFWDSGGFPSLDLFLSRKPDGKIAVVTGKFEGFNRWREPAEYGQIDETVPSATMLIGLDGRVLATFLPTNP